MADTKPHVVAINIDGKKLQLQRLPNRVIDTVADNYGLDWTDVVFAPMKRLMVAQDLIIEVSKYLGIEPPAADLTPVDTLAYFTTVEDDVPQDTAESDGADPLASSGDGGKTNG